MKIFKRLLLGLGILFAAVILGFIIWGSTPALPMDAYIEAMRPSDTISVQAGKWIVFTPTKLEPKTGFILYPGARVDYRAYAPYARKIAEEGYRVIIPRMPLNMALFGVNSAEKIMKAYPNISQWVLGGHSLGGAMAASYVYRNQSEIAGLILLASYPAENDNLQDYKGDVLSISASLDGLSTTEEIKSSVTLLPDNTEWVIIEGGNHAQFGWYGVQKGDLAATISREEQQDITVDAIVKFLNELK